MWLTLLALRNRIGILMLSLAMVVLGATSLHRLPVDLFPNIQVPVAFVGVIYKGAPPLDIEQSVVYPIEKAVSSASNVEHVESFAKQGIGAVQIWFNWGADINVGQMEVMQRITQILNSLPPGILQPFIVKFDVSNIPVSFVTVSSDDLDERALYDLAFNTIAPQIEQIANVAAATVEGGKIRQININLDPALLNARGFSILDVVKSVKAANLILPSGDIKAGNLDYNVFTNNQFRTVEPIQDVIVKVNQQGNPVRVRDLGTVTDSSDIQTNIVRTDGASGRCIFASTSSRSPIPWRWSMRCASRIAEDDRHPSRRASSAFPSTNRCTSGNRSTISSSRRCMDRCWLQPSS